MVNCLLNIYVYVHRFVLRLPMVREATYYMDHSVETHYCQNAEKKNLGVLNQRQDSYINNVSAPKD